MAEFDVQTGSNGSTNEAPTAIAEAEPPVADANADAEPVEDGTEIMSVEDPAQPDDQAALLIDLARAMHDAAEVRHERALEGVDRLRSAQVDEIRERGVSEAEAARDQANRDVAAIHDWSESEIERIHTERERRNQARSRELKALLDRFDTEIEWEIGAIEAAVADYRADLATFFTRLRAETDVTVIARLAQDAPQLPEFEDVTAAARARAAAAGSIMGPRPSSEEQESLDAAEASSDAGEQQLIGVMDPSSSAEVQDPWSFEKTSQPNEGESVGTLDAGEETVGASEDAAAPRSIDVSGTPVTATPALVPRSNSTGLLQAIPALRPVASWLNHGNGGNDKTT